MVHGMSVDLSHGIATSPIPSWRLDWMQAVCVCLLCHGALIITYYGIGVAVMMGVMEVVMIVNLIKKQL